MAEISLVSRARTTAGTIGKIIVKNMAKTASVDNTLLYLLNSSYPTQPHSLIANYSTLFILTINFFMRKSMP